MTAELQKPWLDAGLVTTDPETAGRFYGEVLGLPLADEMRFDGVGLMRRYQVGDSTLRVFVPEKAPAREGSREGFASQTGIRYLTLYIANLEAVVEAARAAGFRVPMEPRPLRPGVRVAQVEDADGNTVELQQLDA